MQTFNNAEDFNAARAYARQVFKVNRANRTRYACPTCGKADALCAFEQQQGYHCASCTRATEFGCE